MSKYTHGPDCNTEFLVCPAILWADGEIDRLRGRIAELVAALEPFAKMADEVDEWQRCVGPFTGHFDANDLRKARDALAKAKAES